LRRVPESQARATQQTIREAKLLLPQSRPSHDVYSFRGRIFTIGFQLATEHFSTHFFLSFSHSLAMIPAVSPAELKTVGVISFRKYVVEIILALLP